MSSYRKIHYPFVAILQISRHLKYLFWSVFHRTLMACHFARIGRGVIFNGRVRVEKLFGDIRIGDGTRISLGCYFLATREGHIHIGEEVGINDHCYITSNYGITIGSRTRIAEFVSIRDYDHKFEDIDIPIRKQGLTGGPISIGEDSWIGRGVMVTSGVTIGKGCVIGANAVVTRDIPDYSVAAGVPARVLRSRIPTGDKHTE
jgi:acetyltransferase-like isoleucine patch superfamily enzyme